ncbi:MAG: carbamoyltransferase C-terminal domain-containing protein [Planctomycetaceae bacterium]
MYVLGINSVFHESAACLLDNGQIVAAAEEERFSRIKHAKTPQVDNPNILPLSAMAYCLEAAGIDLRQVDAIGYSSNPDALAAAASDDDSPVTADFIADIRSVPRHLGIMGFGGEFHWVDHHLAHGASAFFASEFDNAAVLSVDGIGDGKTTAGYLGEGRSITPVYGVPSPHSIGFLWELTSMFLGFDIYDATKIMGLSAYGEAGRYEETFRKLIRPRPDGQFRVDEDRLRFWELDYGRKTGYFAGLETLFDRQRRRPHEELEPAHYDIAAALQTVTDAILLHIVRHLHAVTNSANLCLAGGVALNCVSNQRVFEDGPFAKLYVQPAAHDAGTAIGAATFVWHHVLDNDRSEGLQSASLGPEFSNSQIEDALRRRGLNYQTCDNVERDVAIALGRGEIVGYLQGRMEIGPRALGNRSLLADPRNPNMRDILNAKVKHREFFRPFAPSVLHEEANDWFHIRKPSTAAEFMLMAYSVRNEARDKIPAVIHADGTSRIQTVRRDVNPRYHKLISEFRELTGVPIVLNTSFNDSEPIVCSPDDAIDTFLKTNIDYLAMGDFLVSKSENPRPRVIRTRHVPPTFQRVLPELQTRFETAVGKLRVSRMNGLYVLTDSAARFEPDAAPPLFPEHQFFAKELPPERMDGARVLNPGDGCGFPALAAASLGARHVTLLEPNPRARVLACCNAMLNGYDAVLDVRESGNDIYAPIGGATFDAIVASPRFALEADASASGWNYGLGALERVLDGLDGHLSENGFAQIVTPAPGDESQPTILTGLLARRLRGRVTVKFNPEVGSFLTLIDWLKRNEMIDSQTGRDVRRRAQKEGITRYYLCVIQYERGATTECVVEPAAKNYENWFEIADGVEGPVTIRTTRQPDAAPER